MRDCDRVTLIAADQTEVIQNIKIQTDGDAAKVLFPLSQEPDWGGTGSEVVVADTNGTVVYAGEVVDVSRRKTLSGDSLCVYRCLNTT